MLTGTFRLTAHIFPVCAYEITFPLLPFLVYHLLIFTLMEIYLDS